MANNKESNFPEKIVYMGFLGYLVKDYGNHAVYDLQDSDYTVRISKENLVWMMGEGYIEKA